jgi:hypothetical protein
MVPHFDHPGQGFGLPLIAQIADLVELRSGPGMVLRMHFHLDGTPETNR